VSREPRLYLEDIREFCQKVLQYSAGLTFNEFVEDQKTFDAVIRNLEITGEAARQLSTEFKERYPEVPWRRISGFRDIAIHAYLTIEAEIVWDIIQNKVPELLEQIERILAAEFPEAS
jgi:uncharacterized protein with HEPN domain